MESKMISNEELVEFLLKNRLDDDGDLDLSGLDFRGLTENVSIRDMKVDGTLFQDYQTVGKSLFQGNQEVKASIIQGSQKVGMNLYQNRQKVKGNLYQSTQCVEKDLFQREQKVGGCLYNHDLEDNYYSEDIGKNIDSRKNKLKSQEDIANEARIESHNYNNKK